MRVQAPRSEGVGLKLEPRDLAHSDPEWYQRDLDDALRDPDVEPPHPLPTERHRKVPML